MNPLYFGLLRRGGAGSGAPASPTPAFSWEPEIAQTPPASISLTRATTAMVLTTTDGTTNWYQTAKSGEIRYEGLRRVENLLDSATGSGPFTSITKEGRVAVSVIASSGTLTITIGGVAQVFTPTGTPQRFVAFDDAVGTTAIVISGTATLSEPMAHLCQVGSDLPEPFVSHSTTFNANVAGVQYFTTTNDGSVDGNGVVTEASGTSITGGGYLAEPASTNGLTQSTPETGWSNVGTTITDNGISSYGLRSVTIDAGTSPGIHYITTATSSRSNMYVDASAGTGRYLTIRVGDNNTTEMAVYDLVAGTVTEIGGAISSANIEEVESGIYRCSLVPDTPQTSAVLIGVSNTATPGTAVPSFIGANETIDIYHIQTSALDIATSPIVTSGSTVTRNADVLAGTAWIASAPYSVFVDQTAPQVLSAENRILRLDTGINDLETDASGNITLTATAGLSLSPAGAITAGDRDKMAFRYAANDAALAVEGKTTVTDASVTEAVNAQGDLNLGGAGAGGIIHKVQTHSVGLTNTQLETLVV